MEECFLLYMHEKYGAKLPKMHFSTLCFSNLAHWILFTLGYICLFPLKAWFT